MAHTVKLENNAITIYDGSNIYASVTLPPSKAYPLDTDPFLKRITARANETASLEIANNSTFLALIIKRKIVASSSLPTESPLLVFATCNLFSSQIGELNVWSFDDGIQNLEIRNSSSYPITIECLAITKPLIPTVVVPVAPPYPGY